MAKSSIISSKKQHTVSLPEGSKVATRKAPPAKTQGEQPPATARVRTGTVPASKKTARDAREVDSTEEVTVAVAEAAPPEPAMPELSDQVRARIAELKRFNQAVRAALPPRGR